MPLSPLPFCRDPYLLPNLIHRLLPPHVIRVPFKLHRVDSQTALGHPVSEANYSKQIRGFWLHDCYSLVKCITRTNKLTLPTPAAALDLRGFLLADAGFFTHSYKPVKTDLALVLAENLFVG